MDTKCWVSGLVWSRVFDRFITVAPRKIWINSTPVYKYLNGMSKIGSRGIVKYGLSGIKIKAMGHKLQIMPLNSQPKLLSVKAV